MNSKCLVNFIHEKAAPFVYDIAIKYDSTGMAVSTYDSNKAMMDALERELLDDDIIEHFTVLLSKDGKLLEILNGSGKLKDEMLIGFKFVCDERDLLLSSMDEMGLGNVDLLDKAIIQIGEYLEFMTNEELQEFKDILLELIEIVIEIVLQEDSN